MSSDAFRPTVAQIEHVALATDDLERLCDFYQQLGTVASPPCTDPDTVKGANSRVASQAASR